ncbi:AraC family transcriptional regulator ligand-binding domain-containing protein [Klebsiella variicola subsp. variicola]|nr:AraC family transcriptional regulator ligand-binding domain-containing protein [Klebsiella variicola subsp. variicola]
MFDPPLFAALCSTHMMQAVQRLAKYKLLIAPMVLETTVVQNGTLTVFPRWLGATEIPASLEVAELAFLLRLNRLATREPVQAVKVTLSKPLTRQQTHHFSAFFGTTIQHGKRATISFAAADALRPF